MPRLDILSSINSIPHLFDLDADVQLPTQTNFKYYTTHDFHNSYEVQSSFSKNSFSSIHCNIRSLAANFDNLTNMLEELQHPFSLIGLTETKIKIDQNQITNTKLSGYNFISQPSLSIAGGVGIFIQETFQATIRDDLTITKEEFEALWIEIDNNSQRNIIRGVIYRHPNANVETFMDYINQAIEKIHRENKCCLVMGHFNINLLNFDTHPITEDFINTFETHFFIPQILQPTRITDHSATLIDNIFFNSIEHHVISGNILSDITDHLPCFLVINKLSTLPTKIKIYRRDYSNFDETAFFLYKTVTYKGRTAQSRKCDANANKKNKKLRKKAICIL